MSAHRKRRVLIGQDAAGAVWLDVAKLVRTKLLIQANSGGGKSHLIRRILEQTHGAIQQIVLDVEGEYTSLRERFDYVLAGKDGETPADPRGARMLAERLLELRASALIDLYELKPPDRVRFVRLFLDSMVNAPKHLWHPVLVVIDEAHIFCPQEDRKESESAAAVIDLCSRGRKRGFCAVLATQRLSKLHKDAAAECNNKLIGRTSLDTDIKRASNELGFAKREQRNELRDLDPGEFYAFGPALSRVIRRIKVGDVTTRHPKAGGARLSHRPPKPTKHIRKLLPRLADLPAEQEHRDLTLTELKAKLTDTRVQLKASEEKRIAAEKIAKGKRPAPVYDARSERRLIALAREVQVRARPVHKLSGAVQSLAHSMLQLMARVNTARAETVPPGPGVDRPPTRAVASPAFAGTVPDAAMKLLRGDRTEARIAAVIRANPGAMPAKIAARAHVSQKRSTFRLALWGLRKAGVIDGDKRDGYTLTPLGVAATAGLPAVDATNPIDMIRKQLPDGFVKKLFEAMLDLGLGGALVRPRDIEARGIDTNISTFRLAVSTLKHLNAVTGDKRDGFRINQELVP